MSKINGGAKRRAAAAAAGLTESSLLSGTGGIGPRHAVSESERHEHIRVAAYFLAERRGFGEGQALEDWLRAEAQVGTVGSPDGAGS